LSLPRQEPLSPSECWAVECAGIASPLNSLLNPRSRAGTIQRLIAQPDQSKPATAWKWEKVG
jgi:hypothetical protein